MKAKNATSYHGPLSYRLEFTFPYLSQNLLWWKAFECTCQMLQTEKNTCFSKMHSSTQVHTPDALRINVHRNVKLQARRIATYVII